MISNDPFILTRFFGNFQWSIQFDDFSYDFWGVFYAWEILCQFLEFFLIFWWHKYDLLLARKSTDFSSFSLLENQQILACAWLLTMKSTDQHLIWAFLLARNLLISAAFTGKKISWFQHEFVTRKSADFSSYSWLRNQLISTCFCD